MNTFIINLHTMDKKKFLGEKRNKVCRFCGKCEGEVTFKKEAHAISHLMGNNRLFSYWECDDCNERFSRFENDLGIYMLPIRAIYNIKGKRKNKFKINNLQIENQDRLVIQDTLNEKNVPSNMNLNFSTRELEFCVNRSGYIPNNVFKAFVKMALTVVPKNIFNRLSGYNKFLNGDIENIPNQFLNVWFIPGMNNDKQLILKVIINDNQSDITIPLVVFCIRTKGFEYQINLYEHNYYAYKYENIVIQPVLDDYQKVNNIKPKLTVKIMNSSEKAKDIFKINFKYEKIKEANIDKVQSKKS